MSDVTQWLLHTDREVFLTLNGLHTSWMDVVMYWITYKFTWVPMYVFLLALTVRSEGKRSAAMILTILIAVIVADKITSGLMKPYFMRPRPCHDISLQGLMHGVGGCGGMYGFASSHASTSFAVATTWFFLLRHKFPQLGWLFVWAAIYSYSRVYVGVHYPGDIFVGGMIGVLVGLIFVRVHHIFVRKYYLN